MTQRRISLRVGCLLVAVLVAGPSGADDRVPLTAAQVQCNRSQLWALLERASVTTPAGGLPERAQTLFATYSNRYGFYEGLVVTEPWNREEPPIVPPGDSPTPIVPSGVAHLAFHLDPDVRELLVNPGRPPLPQVSLTREGSTSTLVEPGDAGVIQLRLRPTLGSEPSEGDLVIDNLAGPPPAGPGFRPADTKPGRGLSAAGLTELCHQRFTDTDRRVFAILQRTLVPLLVDEESLQAFDTRVAVYREEAPDHYMAEVYPVDPGTGRLQRLPVRVGVTVGVGDDGRLAEGAIALTGGSYAGYIAVARPVFPGPDAAYEYVASAVPTMLGVIPGAKFDWRDVLDGTSWNGGPARRECGLGTAEEIAATPRDRVDLEELALHVGGGLTASEQVYQRVVADAESIRRRFAQAEQFGTQAAGYGPLPNDLVLKVDGATFQSVDAGTYRAWDCLNDWYGVTRVEAVQTGDGYAVDLQLDGIYDVSRLFPEYEALPGVLGADTVVPITIAAESNTCGEADGTLFRYYYLRIGPPFTPGSLVYFYFTSQPGEEPVLVDSRTVDSPPPPWAAKANC